MIKKIMEKIKQLFCNCKTFTVVHAKFCKDCGAHFPLKNKTAPNRVPHN